MLICKFFKPSVADDPFGETDCSTVLKKYLLFRMNFSLSVDNTSTRCPKKTCHPILFAVL